MSNNKIDHWDKCFDTKLRQDPTPTFIKTGSNSAQRINSDASDGITGFAGCCLIGRLHSRRKNQLVILCWSPFWLWWSPACQVWLWCLRWGLSSDDDDLEAVGGANKLSQETQIPRNVSLHWILVRLTGWEVGEFSETFLYFPTIACYLYLGRSSSVLKYQMQNTTGSICPIEGLLK